MNPDPFPHSTTPDRGARPLPFFESIPVAVPGTSRFLLVSYHFPPAGTVGALRWQKLVQLAQVRGWVFDVITLDPADMEMPDRSRLAKLPPGTRVYGARMPKRLLERMEELAWRCYARLRGRKAPGDAVAPKVPSVAGPLPSPPAGSSRGGRMRALRRAYFAWMDYYTHAGWVAEASRLGGRLIESGRYRAIITSGPPHMAHEAGRRLAAGSGLPLVVDLRDAWSLVQRLADVFDSPLWYRLARRHERPVMEAAALIVMNTARAQAAMRAAYPRQQDRIIAVMNGFDDEPLPPAPEKSKFVVAYAGAMYLDRDPTQLLDVLARVVRDLALTPVDISLEFMGHVESYQGVSLQELARQSGVGEFVSVAGPGPRDAALAFMSRASVLVSLPLFQGRGTGHSDGRPLQGDSDMAIPAKLFEYMLFDAWLLVVAQQGSAAELLMKDSGADLVAPGDSSGMVEVLKRRFREFRAGMRPVKVAQAMPAASRRAQAAILFDAIEDLGQGGTPNGSCHPGVRGL